MLGTVSLLGYACAPLTVGAVIVLILVYTVPITLVKSLVSTGVVAIFTIWSILATLSFFKNIAP